MKTFTDLNEFNISGETAVTIGKFDGFHLGHRELLDCILEEKKKGLKAVVVSIRSGRAGIFSHREAQEYLEGLGIDCFVCIPLTEEFRHLSPENFAVQVLAGKLHAKVLACGRDFRFGYGREGNADMLAGFGKRFGFKVRIFDKVLLDGSEISSSMIREAMENGDMERVNRALGRDYAISGEIVHGKALGRRLGFPTINILPEADKLLPKFGVYFTLQNIDGKEYGGMANVGIKPTVTDEAAALLEVNLLDFSGDIYGRQVVCRLKSFIRPEMKFESVESLKNQVLGDIAEAKNRLNGIDKADINN